jgi:hypothetical protein
MVKIFDFAAKQLAKAATKETKDVAVKEAKDAAVKSAKSTATHEAKDTAKDAATSAAKDAPNILEKTAGYVKSTGTLTKAALGTSAAVGTAVVVGDVAFNDADGTTKFANKAINGALDSVTNNFLKKEDGSLNLASIFGAAGIGSAAFGKTGLGLLLGGAALLFMLKPDLIEGITNMFNKNANPEAHQTPDLEAIYGAEDAAPAPEQAPAPVDLSNKQPVVAPTTVPAA